MSKIELNSKYAPGISTYGAEGAQGKNGNNGYSIYYIPYDISTLLDDEEESVELSLIKNDILNNRFINTNLLGEKEILNRTYQINDMFILPNYKLFSLYKLSTEYNIVEFKELGELNRKFPFNTEDNISFNNRNTTLVLGNLDLSKLTADDKKTPLVVFDNNGKFISLGKKNNSLNIEIDNKNFFRISSDNPISFENGLYVPVNNNVESITTENGNIYYKAEYIKIPNEITVYTNVNFSSRNINLESVIPIEIPNASYSLEILYKNDNDELYECTLVGLERKNYIITQNNIININLVVNFNDSYISKTYKLILQ